MFFLNRSSVPRADIGILLTLGGVFFVTATTWIIAHEGHVTLPSKGAKVDVAKGSIALSAAARFALDVQSQEIGQSLPPESTLAYATLIAPWKQHAFAISRLAGRIVAIHAKPGQHVEAGFLLAEMECQESEILRLDVQNALIEMRLSEKILAALNDSGGAVSESSILAAESQLKQARNTLELTKIKWQALGFPDDVLGALLKGTITVTPKLPIYSPLAGTVLHADLSIGKIVEPGEHLFELVDLRSVWARVGVLEKDINKIKKDQNVSLNLTSYPGESFLGKIMVVGQMLDPISHLNEVWVEYKNPPFLPPRLLPGMTGQARIESPRLTKTQSILSNALINDGVNRFVLVEEASASGVSEYQKRNVVVVRETPQVTEVRSPDLFPGDKVVTQGSHELGAYFASGVLRIGPESAESIGLKWGTASNQIIDNIVEVPVTVDIPPDRRAAISSRMAGTLVSIRVEPGQAIKPGDSIGEIFSLEFLGLQLDLLRENLAKQLALEQLQRLRGAIDSVSRRRMVEAEATFAQASNRLDSQMRRLNLVGLSTEEVNSLLNERRILPTLPVRASVGGTAVRFDRVIGQTVRLDEPLFEIHDLGRSMIQAFVSEQDLSRVRLEQSARIRMVSSPNLVITGKVVRSGNSFGVTDRTLSVWIEPDAMQSITLRHNLMGTAALVGEPGQPALTVPITAILREGSQYYTFVQKPDGIDRRLVQLGRRDDRVVEIRQGLQPGDVIAISAVEALQTAYASVR